MSGRYLGLMFVCSCGFTGSGQLADAPADTLQDGGGLDMGMTAAGPKRRSLTIPSGRVATDLHDFPVYVDVALPGASADSAAIYFTDKAGVAYPFELQKWNPPNVQAWVRVPNVAKSGATVIVVHYGLRATSPPGTSSGAAVFATDNKFAAVWHLESATSPVADATGARDGTSVGFTGAANMPAMLGDGVLFDGSNVITFVNPLVGAAAHTISAWIDERNTLDENEMIIKLGTGSNNAQIRWMNSYWDVPNSFAAGFAGANDLNTTPPVDLRNTGLHLLHWVAQGGDKKNRLYVDGVEVYAFTTPDPPATTGTDGYLGNGGGFGGSAAGVKGIIDEVRISTAVRSDDWITAEHVNQRTPGDFYMAGPEEDDP